jgi:transposase
VRKLVPDEPWQIVQPLIPPQQARPQGRGTRLVEAGAAFTAVVDVPTTGCAWRRLPQQPNKYQRTVPTADERLGDSWPYGSAAG